MKKIILTLFFVLFFSTGAFAFTTFSFGMSYNWGGVYGPPVCALPPVYVAPPVCVSPPVYYYEQYYYEQYYRRPYYRHGLHRPHRPYIRDYTRGYRRGFRDGNRPYYHR